MDRKCNQLARTTVLPLGKTSRRRFFFDRSSWTRDRNVHPVYAEVEKHGVLIEGDAPWENGEVASFASSIVRLDDGRYRLYYTYLDLHEIEEMRIGVAESTEGLKWEKILLGQVKRGGRDSNFLRFSGMPGLQKSICQPQVLRLPDGSWRMYFWKHGDGHVRYTIAESSDGLSWCVPDLESPTLYHPGDKVIRYDWAKGLAVFDAESAAEGDQELQERAKSLMTNDATYVYHNESSNRFECYTVWLAPTPPQQRVEEDNCPGVSRVIQRRLSADGVEWSAAEIVIRPDSHDAWDQQFYHLAVQWHEDWLIGSLGHYRVENGQQTQDIELTFSRDGRSWERPIRGGFIPRDSGGRDSQGIYPPNAWVDRGDNWLCLYSGTARRHNEFGPKASHLPPTCIMGASFPKNRILGLATGQVTGGFMTEPFFLQQSQITIDAKIGGWLRAELCDIWGSKLSGFHLMDCQTIIGDSDQHVLTWNNADPSRWIHTSVRLRFEYKDGVIYSVAF